MTADMARIDELVAWAETESLKETGSAWKQDAWVTPNVPECSTAYCLAGKAVSDAGYQMLLEVPDVDTMVRFVYDEQQPNSRGAGIGDLARDLLGLSYTQAEVLFWSTNSIEDLKTYAKAIANGDDLEDEYENL